MHLTLTSAFELRLALWLMRWAMAQMERSSPLTHR